LGSDSIGRGRTDARGEIFATAQLREAMPGADYVLICAPETAETKAAYLVRLKSQGWNAEREVINVDGGRCWMKRRWFKLWKVARWGARRWTWRRTEPLPAESPLWKAPNIVHHAAHERAERTALEIARRRSWSNCWRDGLTGGKCLTGWILRGLLKYFVVFSI